MCKMYGVTPNFRWEQIRQDIDGKHAGDESGFSVSLSDDENTIAVGLSYNDDNGSNAQAMFVYINAIMLQDYGLR